MASGMMIVNGVVHGRTVELEEEPGLPDGQAVKVMLQPAIAPGEGLRRAFGSWSEDTSGLDEFIAQIYRDRQDTRPGPIE